MLRNFLIVMRVLSALLLLLIQQPAPVQSFADSYNFEAIDAYIDNFMRENNIPGMAVGIVHGEQIVYAKGIGTADQSGRPVTAQTPFILGSTSKSFTALAVLQLVEDGRIDLDAPVQRYLPWFTISDGAMSVRHLLNHTSGIPRIAGQDTQSSNDADAGALERQVRALSRWKLSNLPGSVFEYANANYQIAAFIVQTVTGQPFETYVQHHIFEPLEMRQSFTSKAEAQNHGLASGYHYWFGIPALAGNTPFPRQQFPSGYYISCAEDMAHALLMHLNAGNYNGNQLLSAQGMDTLHRPVLENYAMGWVREQGILSHNGSVPDYGSQIIIDTRRRLGIVILFNINNAIGADHLYIAAPNVLNLLKNSKVMPTPSNSSYHTFLILLPALLIAEIAWLAWSVPRVKQWQSMGKLRPTSKNLAYILVIPVLIELGVAVSLWRQLTEGLWNALLYQPDLTILLVVITGLLISWGSVRTVIGARYVFLKG